MSHQKDKGLEVEEKREIQIEDGKNVVEIAIINHIIATWPQAAQADFLNTLEKRIESKRKKLQ